MVPKANGKKIVKKSILYIVSGPISIKLAKWGDKIIKENPVYISGFFF